MIGTPQEVISGLGESDEIAGALLFMSWQVERQVDDHTGWDSPMMLFSTHRRDLSIESPGMVMGGSFGLYTIKVLDVPSDYPGTAVDFLRLATSVIDGGMWGFTDDDDLENVVALTLVAEAWSLPPGANATEESISTHPDRREVRMAITVDRALYQVGVQHTRDGPVTAWAGDESAFRGELATALTELMAALPLEKPPD